MRKLILLSMVVLAAALLGGCNSAVEDKYDAGRADQQTKADKMIEENASPD